MKTLQALFPISMLALLAGCASDPHEALAPPTKSNAPVASNGAPGAAGAAGNPVMNNPNVPEAQKKLLANSIPPIPGK
jgi:hypothetical protein